MKKVALVLLVVFVGYWLFTDPSGLADTTHDAAVAGGEGVSKLFSAIIDFLHDL
ncbi:MAG: hypothetical protein QM572_13355 [Nocardioides sp.]|uniref:hypothetical protein n=1 Tax=Nocardioides sp. TaxID=35761 RepID=UPI0039E41C8F